MKRTPPALLVALLAVTGAVTAAGCADRVVCERPLVLGHRGTRQMAPENTLPAFDWAMAHGAAGVEADVKRTRDGVLVVMHDDTTGRTTDDRHDRLVGDVTFGELRSLDAGAWFDEAFAHTHVPTLQETFDLLPVDAILVVDHVRMDVVADVAAFSSSRADRVFASGYDASALGLLARLEPEVKRVLFLPEMPFEELAPTLDALAPIAQPDVVRPPKNLDEDPRAWQAVLDEGLELALPGTAAQWLGGYVFADDVEATQRRLDHRRPPWCEEGAQGEDAAATP